MENFNNLHLVFFCSLLLFVVVSHAQSIDDNVSNICQKTTNPSFCTNELKSAGTTDLKELATYALNLAHTNAATSLTLAKSLATSNAQLKEQFLSCSENFNDAIGNIENAQKYLASGDFNGINLATSGVMTTIDDCQESIKQSTDQDTLSLLNSDKILNDVCSIILVISNLLLKPM